MQRCAGGVSLNHLFFQKRNVKDVGIKMPLVKGKKAKTREGFETNLKRELAADKPKKQALAIAYAQKRGKGKK